MLSVLVGLGFVSFSQYFGWLGRVRTIMVAVGVIHAMRTLLMWREDWLDGRQFVVRRTTVVIHSILSFGAVLIAFAWPRVVWPSLSVPYLTTLAFVTIWNLQIMPDLLLKMRCTGFHPCSYLRQSSRWTTVFTCAFFFAETVIALVLGPIGLAIVAVLHQAISIVTNLQTYERHIADIRTRGGETWDVVIIGGGAAGLCSAIFARDTERILLVDAGEDIGGTTKQSGGGVWAPNNHLKRATGARDTLCEFLTYVEACKGQRLTQLENRRATAYYTKCAEAISELANLGMRFEMPSKQTGLALNKNREYAEMNGLPTVLASSYCDYSLHLNTSGLGRTLHPGMSLRGAIAQLPDVFREISPWEMLLQLPSLLGGKFSSQGNGADLVYGLRNACSVHANVSFATRCRMANYAQEADGVHTVRFEGGGCVRARALILACGGAGANSRRARAAADFPLRGSCTNDMCIGLPETDVDTLPSVWLKQVWVERFPGADKFSTQSQLGVWFLSGTSMFMVDKIGRRFCNEYSSYPLRAQAQIDAESEVCALVFDDHCRQNYAGLKATGGAIPFFNKKWLHACDDWDQLVARLGDAMSAVGMHGFSLPRFRANLREQRRCFDAMARCGWDGQFGRGATPANFSWNYVADETLPNACMRSLDEGRCYYVLLAVGCLDTVGQVKVDALGRALRNGSPVMDLYAVGNAAPAILDKARYCSGGITLGNAICTAKCVAEDIQRRQCKAVPP